MRQPRTPPVVAMPASSAALRGRINLAMSLLSHRAFCPTCDHLAVLVQLALAGASIDQLRREDGGR